jgi:prepilin-type N-terminal cleavage/methylation domain-containing protein
MNLRNSTITKHRRAFTLLELSVAAALIAALLVTTVKMVHALEDFRKTVRRRVYAQQAVAAVSEQAGNFQWNELTTAKANEIAIPDGLRPYLSEGKLNVVVADEHAPEAKRITAELTWDDHRGRASAPVRLVTWVYQKEPTSP